MSRIENPLYTYTLLVKSPREWSLVVPVFNEAENIPALFEEISRALASESYEIIFVDDGSTDSSPALIQALARTHPHVTALILARNYGQTAALAAGFQQARGNVLIPLDADGQNDPADIPRLIAKLKEGYDVVSGWRRERQDAFWSRRLPSMTANFFIARITGVPLHDFGCTLKAYRKPALEGLRLYGEMHRFLPAWCAWRGARIAELEVHHRPRTKGHSHYGWGRTVKVFLDLLTTRFISGYLTKPSYVFGGAGLAMYGIAAVSTAVVFYDKFGPDQWAKFRIPLMLLASFMGIIGTLLFLIGLLAELIVRLHFEGAGQTPYQIHDIIQKPE